MEAAKTNTLRHVEGNIVGVLVKTKKGTMEIKSAWSQGLWLKTPNDKSGRIYPYTEPDWLDLPVVIKKSTK